MPAGAEGPTTTTTTTTATAASTTGIKFCRKGLSFGDYGALFVAAAALGNGGHLR